MLVGSLGVAWNVLVSLSGQDDLALASPAPSAMSSLAIRPTPINGEREQEGGREEWASAR